MPKPTATLACALAMVLTTLAPARVQADTATGAAPATASASALDVQLVDLRDVPYEHLIAADTGQDLRGHVVAEPDRGYRLRIHNLSHHALGLVIAVDGCNIIDGATSRLAPSEPMYLLQGGETQYFHGWRKDRWTVHRFVFKQPPKTAITQRSTAAMPTPGTVSVAAFPVVEVGVPAEPRAHSGVGWAQDRHGVPAGLSRAPARSEPPCWHADRTHGTNGWLAHGAHTERSDRLNAPAEIVRFEVKPSARVRILWRYDWAPRLCAQGVLPCSYRVQPALGKGPVAAGSNGSTATVTGSHGY